MVLNFIIIALQQFQIFHAVLVLDKLPLILNNELSIMKLIQLSQVVHAGYKIVPEYLHTFL